MTQAQIVDKRVKKAVSIVARTANKKVGRVAATYTAQATCPATCPFLRKGCYANTGAIGFTTGQRNGYADSTRMLDVIREEADGIRALAEYVTSGKRRIRRDLRVHVVGDSPTDAAAQITGSAMVEYGEVTGKQAWTYTHAWRTVQRASWGKASVLASTESVADAVQAMREGYGAVVVTDYHPADGKAYVVDGVKVVPCPNQTRGVQCVDCRLCFNADGMRERNTVIAFAAHGKEAAAVRSIVQPKE